MSIKTNLSTDIHDINFQDIERQFTHLLSLEDLDREIDKNSALKEDFEGALEYALSEGLAYLRLRRV